MIRNSKYNSFWFFPCLILSHILSVTHLLLFKAQLVVIPDCIKQAPGGLYKNLQKIWFARLVKKNSLRLGKITFQQLRIEAGKFRYPHTNR